MKNETMNKGYSLLNQFREWLGKNWWLIFWIFLLLVSLFNFFDWTVSRFSFEYQMSKIRKVDVIGAALDLTNWVGWALLLWLWISKGPKLLTKIGITGLTIVLIAFIYISAAFTGLGEAKQLAPEDYVDSDWLNNELYHLTVSPGISGEAPGLVLYHCQLIGLGCEQLQQWRTPLIYVKDRYYPEKQTFLIAVPAENALVITQDGQELYKYSLSQSP